MLKNYIKIAFRNLFRQKGYSLLNITGLSVGLACTFLLIIWIRDEMRYDRFHKNGDQLYRVMRHVYSADQIHTSDNVTWNIAEELKEKYAEVKDVVVATWPGSIVWRRNEISSRESGRYASPAFFEMFSWGLIQGTPSKVLTDPKSIVISTSLAKKYFGQDWRSQAVGGTIRDAVGDLGDFVVTGVFEDIPFHSSLRFDFVLPIQVFEQRNNWLFDWNNSGIFIFVQLREDTDAIALSNEIVDIQNEHIEQFRSDLFLQAYIDQHLYSNFKGGKLVGGRIEYVRIFTGVAFIIVLMACINFINLTTARSMRRAREIGVRKTVGAGKLSLVYQFMGESLIIVLIAFMAALTLVSVGLPLLNELTGKMVTIADLGGSTFLLFTGIAFLTALLSGTYPALYLSSFNAVRILRGTFRLSGASGRMRKGLVVFQFAISIVLIFGTIIVYRQIDYIHSKNLGLDRENIIYLRLEGQMREKFNAVKEVLGNRPGIASVTSASSTPLDIQSNTHSVTWRGKDPESQISMNILSVTFDFLEVMKMELVQGRDFDLAFGTDSVNYLINQKAMDVMGFEKPLGEQLSFWGNTGAIVGVVKDFHMSSFYSDIQPTIIQFGPGAAGWIFLRTKPGQTREALASIEDIHSQFNPEYPFKYEFLDESFRQMYKGEVVIGKLAGYFTAFALFIACLGLFGLAVFAAERRTKEIGIRKVMGATVSQIITLLSKDFVKLVIIGFLLSVPAAWYLMNQWLQNFAYRIEINGLSYLLAGLGAILIAMATVSWQAVRAALRNPADSLKSE